MKQTTINLRSLLTAFFLSWIIGVAAQTTVKGVVQDETGDPLIGATVQEKGNVKNGTATNLDGEFTLNVKSLDATLIVSYVGMQTADFKLNGKNNVVITLREDAKSLDDLVVVGYGSMKKSDLAGASSSLTEAAIKGSTITNLDQSLQGRAAGVTAMATSGALAPVHPSECEDRPQSTPVQNLYM